MPNKLPTPPPSRYSLDAARQRIAKRLGEERGSKKKVCARFGWETMDPLSHRLSGKTDLTIEQIGVIADAIDAPTGWPFVDWELGEAFDAYRKLVGR